MFPSYPLVCLNVWSFLLPDFHSWISQCCGELSLSFLHVFSCHPLFCNESVIGSTVLCTYLSRDVSAVIVYLLCVEPKSKSKASWENSISIPEYMRLSCLRMKSICFTIIINGTLYLVYPSKEV